MYSSPCERVLTTICQAAPDLVSLGSLPYPPQLSCMHTSCALSSKSSLACCIPITRVIQEFQRVPWNLFEWWKAASPEVMN